MPQDGFVRADGFRRQNLTKVTKISLFSGKPLTKPDFSIKITAWEFVRLRIICTTADPQHTRAEVFPCSDKAAENSWGDITSRRFCDRKFWLLCYKTIKNQIKY